MGCNIQLFLNSFAMWAKIPSRCYLIFSIDPYVRSRLLDANIYNRVYTISLLAISLVPVCQYPVSCESFGIMPLMHMRQFQIIANPMGSGAVNAEIDA